jgi:lysophospholipase L1-like esterase
LIKAILGRVLLLLGSLLVCIGIVEIVLRASMEFEPELGLYEVDFEVGNRMKPGFRGERHYGVPIAINSHGMRDREFDLEKPPGVFRIIALGDSWTAGLGVHAPETWPKRLEAILNEEWGPVEVLNTGVSGYETYNEARYYERDLTKFEHDLVVVGTYPVNDVNDKRGRYDRHKKLHDTHPLLYQAYMFPRRHLYVHHVYSDWRAERKRERRRNAYLKRAKKEDVGEIERWFPRAKDDWTQLYTDEYRGFRRMKEAYASIGETARAQGVPAAVALFVDLRDLRRYEEYCHHRIQPKIAEAVDSAGLTLIDLAPDFLPWVGNEKDIAIRGNVAASHPNADGYEVIARGIARELIGRGLLPSRAVTAGGTAPPAAPHP